MQVTRYRSAPKVEILGEGRHKRLRLSLRLSRFCGAGGGQKIRRHAGWVGPGVGFQKSEVYLRGTCNARARAWRPRASRVPRRARSREEVPWATAVSSSSRAAPGFRRLTRGCTVAAPAAAPATPGRTAAPRGPARAVWQFSDNQRRATRQLEGNQRKRSSLIGREVGGWAPVAGPKNPSCRRVLFFR